MRLVTVELWGSQYRLVYGLPGKKLLPDDFKEGLKNGKRAQDNERSMDGGADDKQELAGDRLENNIARSRSRLREIAGCNVWDWFFTGTLDAKKFGDRFDLRTFRKRLGEWVGNFNKKYGCTLRYCIVPEQHKNGAWHCHGLFAGLPSGAIRRRNNGYFDLPDYNRRFGFCSLSAIASPERVASYITKYISKDFSASALEAGEHLFYASHGLKGREKCFTLPLPDEACADYEGAWCGLSWISKRSELGDIISSAAADNGLESFRAQAELVRRLSARTDNFTEADILRINAINPQFLTPINARGEG